MQKIELFIFICVISMSVYGQRPLITLDFEVYDNETMIELDSVYIENVTEGCDTAVYPPDNEFTVFYSTGIKDINQAGDGFLLSQNYPNPVGEHTVFRVSVMIPGKIELTVTGPSGRIVERSDHDFDPGIHEFRFTPGNEKYYLLTAVCGNLVRSVKILNQSLNSGKHVDLVYLGTVSTLTEMKSMRGNGGFVYRSGDQLKLIVYARTLEGIPGSDYVFDSPVEDKTYIFSITRGTVCRSEPEVLYEGKTYRTIQIGDLCWFRENLNVGDVIVAGEDDMNDDGVIEKYCYADDPANCDLFGGLYQWDEAMGYVQTSGARGICPPEGGWHIPTSEEFDMMAAELGGFAYAGGHMKATTLWENPNTGADNLSGFTGLPAGIRATLSYDEFFGGLYTDALFWTSDCKSSGLIVDIYMLKYNDRFLNAFEFANHNGFSVRCVKEE